MVIWNYKIFFLFYLKGLIMQHTYTPSYNIEEILYEAHAYGLREQVLETANHLMRNNKFHNLGAAYQMAFESVINEYENKHSTQN
jgi:hypothetical protein